MKLAFAYFQESHHALKNYALQVKADYAVANVPKKKDLPEFLEPWDYVSLFMLKKRFEEYGITLSVIEGPTPMERIKLGLKGRDEEIAHFLEMLKNLSRLGIDTVCYNWMPVFGWFRSHRRLESRGGAHVTGFHYEELRNAGSIEHLGTISQERLWETLEYFLKQVLPTAEQYGIRLALHPDDPPVSELAGISRILTSADAMEQAIRLVPSPCNGITFCQGCFATMGEDILKTIERFAKMNRIFFVHFRDVRGDRFCFEETFHDDGKTDMVKAMSSLVKNGYDGVIRPDHVPDMYGEDGTSPGYGILGNIYAAGYLNGLLEAAEKAENIK